MLYDIKYTETNVGWFEVEADSREEAEDKFWAGVETGEYDLLKTEIMENDATAHRRRSHTEHAVSM